jgi:hypothetical protein
MARTPSASKLIRYGLRKVSNLERTTLRFLKKEFVHCTVEELYYADGEKGV